MKRLILSCLLLSITLLCLSQTKMTNKQAIGNGSVNMWTLSSSIGEDLGKVYTIEKSAVVELKLYPTPDQLSPGNTMVITGTYTSPGGKVAGLAYNKNCEVVGNTQDKFFKPNMFLQFNSGQAYFQPFASCNAIGIYMVVDDSVLTDVVNARTKQPMTWRFFVQKSWIKTPADGASTGGLDMLIVDFNQPMQLSQACEYIKGLHRDNEIYVDPTTGHQFGFYSKIRAGLLDTGAFRPFLLDGTAVHGGFPTNQSNVIIIK